MPPPCSSYACFILDKFCATVSLAAPITVPITSAMPPNTFLANSSAAPNFSFIVANILSTIFLNHSHLLYKSTIAAISATIPITIHVTGFANSAAVKLHTLAIRGCKEVKREVTAVFPIFSKLVPNERIIGKPPRIIPVSFWNPLFAILARFIHFVICPPTRPIVVVNVPLTIKSIASPDKIEKMALTTSPCELTHSPALSTTPDILSIYCITLGVTTLLIVSPILWNFCCKISSFAGSLLLMAFAISSVAAVPCPSDPYIPTMLFSNSPTFPYSKSINLIVSESPKAC